ncbi:MAG TPA: hypothetical protein VMM81_02635 [Acidimicrobiia bacterium]|nr:hypothetical protein [Acidimicrobiia bacterium]
MTGRVWAERLARWAVVVVVVAGVVAVALGLLALVWSPDLPDAPPDACPDPPCFGIDLGGASPLLLLPSGAHLLLLGIALLMGGLSLLLSLVAALRGHGRRALAVGVTAVVGPLLVLVGGEVLPHLLNPCVLPDLAGMEPPGFCVRTAEGVDVADDWHLLDHALVGFLPLSLALAWWWKRREPISTALPPK